MHIGMWILYIIKSKSGVVASMKAYWPEPRILCISFNVTETGCYAVKRSNQGRKVCLFEVWKENQ